ncbi:MAG: type II toxin-antitoxin system RelE/ParE family toxin [Planctomycetota bacterium]|nr:MAG: type II toxin-antitoxin system RelE/ParE family toxin [Planctomycetota bacterium]
MARAKTTYVVEWAVTARDDLDEIIGYILARDPLNALKVNDTIEAQASTLDHMPHRGRIVPELKFHGVINYHELLIGPWRLMYRIEGDAVWVVSLLDGRRQLADLLLERFLRW